MAQTRESVGQRKSELSPSLPSADVHVSLQRSHFPGPEPLPSVRHRSSPGETLLSQSSRHPVFAFLQLVVVNGRLGVRRRSASSLDDIPMAGGQGVTAQCVSLSLYFPNMIGGHFWRVRRTVYLVIFSSEGSGRKESNSTSSNKSMNECRSNQIILSNLLPRKERSVVPLAGCRRHATVCHSISTFTCVCVCVCVMAEWNYSS